MFSFVNSIAQLTKRLPTPPIIPTSRDRERKVVLAMDIEKAEWGDTLTRGLRQRGCFSVVCVFGGKSERKKKEVEGGQSAAALVMLLNDNTSLRTPYCTYLSEFR